MTQAERGNSSFLKKLASALVEFLLRKRHPALTLVRASLAFGVLANGGWHLLVNFSMSGGDLVLQIPGNSVTQDVVTWVLIVLTSALPIWGFVWWWRDERRASHRKVIVVELRGLRNEVGDPLIEAVPQNIRGRREQVLMDLRQGTRDGLIVSPCAAVNKLLSLPVQVSILEAGLDRDDITVVFGGLAPVPLTFLAGVLMDDEGQVEVLDWDRHASRWRLLDGVDEGDRFRVTGLEDIEDGARETALIVSVSYRVRLSTVSERLRDVPIVQLSLETGSPESHWSKEKQEEIGKQFLNTIIALRNLGVERIHLFLAAQSSVVFRFGRLYDWRNLPDLVVYQYERNSSPPYPWGVKMPTSMGTEAAVVS